MSLLSLANFCCAVLAGAFLYSGTMKLAQPMDAAVAAVKFRAVKRVRRDFGIALGCAEIFLGLMLLVIPIVPVLTIALILLAVFSGLIIAALIRGDSFSCACFGSSSPISWRGLCRNLALITLTVFALTFSLPPFVDLTERVSSLVVVGSSWILLVAGQELIYRNPFKSLPERPSQ